MENFEEWTGSAWKGLVSDFSVDLRSAAITAAGTFSGAAVASSAAKSENFPALVPVGHRNFHLSGGLNSGGEFKGSFYGPRDDSADLEVAGSWSVGTGPGNAIKWEIYGSFGAKQKPAATPGG